jgi:hypothetical protein
MTLDVQCPWRWGSLERLSIVVVGIPFLACLARIRIGFSHNKLFDFGNCYISV